MKLSEEYNVFVGIKGGVSKDITPRITQLEAELEVWKRPIICHWCKAEVTEEEAVEHYKSCTKNPLRAENEALKDARDVEWRKFVAATKNEQIATLKEKWEKAEAENEELRELFVYFFGENYEELVNDA